MRFTRARGPTPTRLGKVKAAPRVGSSDTSSVAPRRDRPMRRLEPIWRVDRAEATPGEAEGRRKRRSERLYPVGGTFLSWMDEGG
jgi:hypothetical protein